MKKAIILSFLMLLAIAVQAKPVAAKGMYMCGISTSFTDSIMYITDVQQLDVWVDSKTGFLEDRSNYSWQMRNHFSEKVQERRTCIVIYAKDETKLRKKLDRIIAKAHKKNRYTVVQMKAGEFTFTPIEPTIVEQQ